MENSVSVLIEALIRKGWCFRDVEELKGLIQIHIAFAGPKASTESVESELLLNMDLRSFGGKSLPEDPVFKKSSHFQGPKVLQIVSVRDILQSTIEASSRGSRSKRLLRLRLTDGYSEIVAIEYSHVPSIDDDIVPGTKVCLENKAPIQSGIVCLNPKVITVLEGVVQTLHEEWEMSRKYSGFSRSSMRLAQKNGIDGPPPFEKLQIGARPQQFAQHHKSSGLTSKTHAPTVMKSSGNSEPRETGTLQSLTLKPEQTHPDMGKTSVTGKTEEKPSSSFESRPKEVIEAIPVQNQAAAQKLLQKMSQPTQDNRGYRGGSRHRGKERQEEEAVFTLDEWEKRKGGVKASPAKEFHDISRDEELARQLQNQLDFEDYHVPTTGQTSEADRIRMSMFSFGREEEDTNQGRMGFRGRGRGRERGRGRGRR